jgi:signal transduction histidine kinase/ActR/RegA family two-component response regulator
MPLVARLLLLIALAIIPVIAAQIFTQVELRRERHARALADATRYARLVDSDADRLIEGMKGILVAVTEVPFIRNLDRPACSAYLASLAKRYPQFLNITVIDESGTPVCANTTIPLGATGIDRFYFREAMRTNDFVIGEYIVGRTVPRPQLPVALAFADSTSHRFVVAIGLNFDWLQAHFASLALPPGARLLIADRTGVVLVAPSDAQLIGQPLPFGLQPVHAPREGAFEYHDRDGDARVVGFEPSSAPPVGVIVAVDLSQRQTSSAAEADNRRDLGIMLLSALAAAGLAWFGGRHFVSRPLQILTSTANKWRDGKYDARTGLADMTSEIGRLGLAFDHMADVVETNQQALRNMNEVLEQRVKERTAELWNTNVQLTVAMAEREKIEIVLRQAQKMEAIGQLTGGIAHDFNNLLTVILGNLELAAKKSDGQDELRRWIINAQKGGERATRLTRHLLAFARQQTLRPTHVDLNQLVTDMTEFLHRTLGPSIEIAVVLAADVGLLNIDEDQLETAILNLCINARDAMANGGKLTIETANSELDADYAANHPEVTAGPYIQIAVSDTGTGMPADVIARVFDPFFTTKPVGRGSGLGLSMVYGFVKQSGGHVTVYSEVGQGTSFKLYLPRNAAGGAVAVGLMSSERSTAGAGERILVVEDDQDVRDYVAIALRGLGYLVLEARDTLSALTVLNSPESVDLLFTDIGLPGQDGRKLVEEARIIRPHLKVLFTTGYARNAVVQHGALEPNLLLPKPFTIADLAAKVREALERREDVTGLPNDRPEPSLP